MNTETATRSDLDALTALNRDYIHSVQHGDVQRFDEILAEDFLCSKSRRVGCRQETVSRTDRSTGDDQWPLGAGRPRANSRKCRDHSRAHQLHHGGW